MKSILLIITLALFASCNVDEDNTIESYHILIIDGCEYLEYERGKVGSTSYFITHKGDCDNPIHLYNSDSLKQSTH